MCCLTDAGKIDEASCIGISDWHFCRSSPIVRKALRFLGSVFIGETGGSGYLSEFSEGEYGLLLGEVDQKSWKFFFKFWIWVGLKLTMLQDKVIFYLIVVN